MFNIGPGELIVIGMVALIVLGPQRLPEAFRTVGRFVGELRRMSSGFQNEIRTALEDDEIEDVRRQIERPEPVINRPEPEPVIDVEPEPEAEAEADTTATPPRPEDDA